MEKSFLIFENSPWLILVCLAVGAGLTYLLYRKPGPWNKTTHYLLMGFRFILISFLCFLLIGPIVKQFNNRVESPYYVIAVDNSTSLSEVLSEDILNGHIEKVKELGATLSSNGYGVAYRTLNNSIEKGQVDSIRFNHPSTPPE